jgi:HPt (histidine-containing phosphotransfer) domain-containing protein
MNPLASRKQLLVAESELNRAQLVQEWQAITDDVHALADRARTIRSLASAAATLVSGLVALRQKKSAPAAKKISWWQRIFQGAQLAGSLWTEFRAQDSSQK